MKVKEVSRTANVAWSPANMQVIHMACGTVAQQLDATFSTSAKLEVFSLDLASSGPDMSLVGAIETPHRFHKLVWSSHGMSEGDHTHGLIIGGSDNGVISIWSAQKIIESLSDPEITSITQHTGAVRALDVNPFQPNLLASGASESEIFIWDLNNPATPMSPGNKTHPLDDISGVAWNRQVQHIIASTSPGGRSVVWDLRKNEPIIQISDSSSRIQCSGIAWHPDVATQLVTSSVDDRSPIIQMWDLRHATSPMKILEQHQRGVLSLAWCPQDSDLLLSAAKDNRVLCWNPNSSKPGGEVVYELPSTSQWIFECQWCPRNPAIISTASFDGHVTMYSLLGGGGGEGSGKGGEEVPTEVLSSGGDFFDEVSSSSAGSRSLQRQAVETAPLKTPPKWFRRPCGASFTFGGKLVSFSDTRGVGVAKTVCVSSVVTEQEFIGKSHDFESSISQGKYQDVCEQKINSCSAESEKNVWNFLKVAFEENPRRQYLKLLGYDMEELEKKFSVWSKMKVSTLPTAGGLDVNELSRKLSTIPVLQEEGEELQDGGVASSETSSTAAMFGSEIDGHGGVFDTISLNDPSSSNASKRASFFAGATATPPTSVSSAFFSIPTDGDTDGMLAQAMLVGNFEAAVDICISADRMAEAMVLAVAGGSDLLKRTQQVFFNKHPSKVSKLISAVVNRNWTEVARYGNLENWREILAALVTYAGPEDFSSLCDLLGNRLEQEQEGQYSSNSSLCYICSGNVEKFVECLSGPTAESNGKADPLVLQDMMEKVMLLRKAVSKQRKESFDSSSSSSCDVLNKKLRLYSSLLSSQGSLKLAFDYLSQNNDSSNAILKDRLYQAQGLTSSPRPEFPFSLVNVNSRRTAPSEPAPAPTPTPAVMPVMGNPSPISATQPFVSMDTRSREGGYAPHTSHTGYGGSAVGTPGTFVGQDVSPNHIPSNHVPSPIPPVSTYQKYQGAGTPLSVSNPGFYNPMSSPAPVAPPNAPLPRSGGAWNDPPALRNKKAPSSVGQGVAPITAPITAPIMQPVQPDPQSPLPEASEMVHQPSPSPSPVQKAPPPVIQKAPIPQEHSTMVQAFDAMLTRCRAAANNLGTRKKLEDIDRKLSILYDLLRESRVSPNVVQGLNYMAQCAQAQDYRSGLGYYNQMVSSGNFSEISGFMPGIKTLLNLGTQLRV